MSATLAHHHLFKTVNEARVPNIPNGGAAAQGLHHSSHPLWDILSLSSGWYWEQDKRYRFSFLDNLLLTQHGLDVGQFVGKTWWELGAVPAQGTWQEHWSALAARAPFADFIARITYATPAPRYIISAGMPYFDGDRFVGYRGISRDITSYWRGEQLQKLEHAITRQLVEAGRLDEAVQGVIRTLCEAEEWACGSFWQPLGTDGALQSKVSWMAPSTPDAARDCLGQEHLTIVAAGQELPGWVGQQRRPLWVPDVSVDPRSSHGALAEATGLRSAMLFPVVAQDRLLGVFGFAGREVREPDPGFLEALSAISSQIGLFIQRQQAQTVLRAREERFRSITEFTSDWYWEQDDAFRFVDVAGKDIDNPQLFLGKTHWDPWFRCEPVGCSWAEHQARLQAHEPFHDLILKSVTHTGTLVYYAVSGRPVIDEQGQLVGYRGIGKDITEQKRAEEHIQYLARHDSLTGLPNRSHFSETLNKFILNAQRYQHDFAVLFIDLDRFKYINDTLGHEAGDELLKEISRRLTDTLRASDVVARLGGDEFVVLLPEVASQSDIAHAARKLLTALTRPVELQGQECRVTASIGVSQYPGDAQDEQNLIKFADMAMYRAKERGKNTFQFFSESLRAQSLERLALESSLRRALERGELLLHYQAKRDLESGQVGGVEALLRWQHPDLGMISPAQFIPLAEETGLIIPLGRWVLQTACAQNVAWQRAGLPGMTMAVNLSAKQFTDENLLNDITTALTESGMAPELLELELTESMVMQNCERAVSLLLALKEIGVRLAIDDFGTGYSSLAQLKHFPIDTLKIDRSFICDLPQSSEDCAIAQAIIAMGKTLGLRIVAEGVETREQEQFLRDNACDESQGYYFSPPLPADALCELLCSDRRYTHT